MNLWKKIIILDKKIDDKSRNKMGNILTLVFSLSFISGILFSATLRTIRINTINQNKESIRRMEVERMNRLIEKAFVTKY